MRKFLLASAAILALGAASPVLAQSTAAEQSDAGAAIGGSAGAATGATAGFFVGGPIGAVVGGFAGAILGASAGVSAASVNYVSTHPVQPVYLDGPVDVGTKLNSSVEIYPVQNDAAHGYFYANGRAYIVDAKTRTVVMSPGYIIPQADVTYARSHRRDSISIKADIRPGYRFDKPPEYGQLPDNSAYSYVYVNDQPALVDNRTNTIVWVGQ